MKIKKIKNKKFILSLFSLFILCMMLASPVSYLYADDYAPAIAPFNVRSAGMGSVSAAVADDWYLFFSNPAGLTLESKYQNPDGEWMINYDLIGINFGHSFIDLITFISDNADTFGEIGDLENMSDEDMDVINEGMDKLIGTGYVIGVQPIYLSFMLGGGTWNVGAALYGVTDNTFSLNNTVVPRINLNLEARAGGIVSFAFNISDLTNVDLHVGISVKMFGGTHYYTVKHIYDVENLPDEIVDSLTNIGFGMGFDLGFIYESPEISIAKIAIGNIRAGLVFQDIYTFISNQVSTVDEISNVSTEAEALRVQPDIGLGVAWIINFGFLPDMIMGPPIVSLELSDMLEADTSGLLMLKFGAEIPLFNLTGGNYILVLRGGLNQGYLVGGATLGLWYVDINYAFNQREKGVYPGQIVEQTHMLSISFRF